MNNPHPSPRRVLGIAGERTAQHILRESGYTILECNWRDGRRGELDIVARSGPGEPECTVIVEVRTRMGQRCGGALESVTPQKMKRLRALTAAWCRSHPPYHPRIRIDVIALTVHASTRGITQESDLREYGAQIQWIRGAQ